MCFSTLAHHYCLGLHAGRHAQQDVRKVVSWARELAQGIESNTVTVDNETSSEGTDREEGSTGQYQDVGERESERDEENREKARER